MVVHSGQASGGHYYSYILHRYSVEQSACVTNDVKRMWSIKYLLQINDFWKKYITVQECKFSNTASLKICFEMYVHTHFLAGLESKHLSGTNLMMGK